MAQKLGEALVKLAQRANMDTNSEAFKGFLSNVAVATTDLPDDIWKGLDTGLLNEEAARNNVAVRRPLQAEAYDGVGKKLKATLKELGLEDSDFADLDTINNVTDRLPKGIQKLVDKVKASAGKGASDENTKALEVQIAELKKSTGALKEQHAAALLAERSGFEAKELGYQIGTALSKHRLTPLIPGAATYAQVEMAKHLQKINVVPKAGANGIELFKADGDKLVPFTDNAGKHVNFDTVAIEALTAAKLLDTSPPQGVHTPQQQGAQPQNPVDPTATQRDAMLAHLRQGR